MDLGLNQNGLISKVVVYRGGRSVGFHCILLREVAALTGTVDCNVKHSDHLRQVTLYRRNCVQEYR